VQTKIFTATKRSQPQLQHNHEAIRKGFSKNESLKTKKMAQKKAGPGRKKIVNELDKKIQVSFYTTGRIVQKNGGIDKVRAKCKTALGDKN
jgi:hypothetical protein